MNSDDKEEMFAEAVKAMRSFTTKDSGERQSFDSGMVRDIQTGKPRFDLMVPNGVAYEDQMLTRFAALLGRGAEKYGDRNWEKADGDEELQRARSSAFRHMMQWFCGETDEDHAAAVFFNITMAEYLKGRMKAAEEPQVTMTHFDGSEYLSAIKRLERIRYCPVCNDELYNDPEMPLKWHCRGRGHGYILVLANGAASTWYPAELSVSTASNPPTIINNTNTDPSKLYPYRTKTQNEASSAAKLQAYLNKPASS
jgi:hypothetical protein